MKTAVLLLAHGAPERVEDLPEYLTYVRGGRLAAPQLVEELKRRYAEVGGSSPLLARTRDQARALESRLGVPVYVGMRNWHPFIKDTLERMQGDQIERIVVLCLVPQYSKMTAGAYFRQTREAREALGLQVPIIWTESLHDNPELAEAFREKLVPLLPAEVVLFTAHSLPEHILRDNDPYDAEVKATARAVALRSGIAQWDFAYQSQGMTGDRWLGPTVESRLDDYARRGVKDVVLAPIGFVSDHVEILYDVDILFRNYALERGIRLRRPESLNDSPAFIAALAGVVRQRLEAA
jgi:ferrochelatase